MKPATRAWNRGLSKAEIALLEELYPHVHSRRRLIAHMHIAPHMQRAGNNTRVVIATAGA